MTSASGKKQVKQLWSSLGLRQRPLDSDSPIFHGWTIRRINDGHMKHLSVYDFYVLGRVLEALSQWPQDAEKANLASQAHRAHEQLTQAVDADSVLLPASRDAARLIIQSLEMVFGENIGKWNYESYAFPDTGDNSEKIGVYAGLVGANIHRFETIFTADLPRMTVFAAESKGIYQTDKLIDSAEEHFLAAIRTRLPKQAKTDLHFAGKCLAFDTPTACAFHMWRALEIIFGAYYVSITGKTFKEARVRRNWGDYIKALVTAGADQKITGNLDHIREHYRNPIMHPNEDVTDDEAFNLFGIGTSAITQVMLAIETQPHADKALAGEASVEDFSEGW
jgi:hypothetical protein